MQALPLLAGHCRPAASSFEPRRLRKPTKAEMMSRQAILCASPAMPQPNPAKVKRAMPVSRLRAPTFGRPRSANDPRDMCRLLV
jgi:hypothetical protein